jgi:hypothetical protein
MADLRDFTGKNRKFTGTIGERISSGTTGQRDEATFGGGTLRFNSSTNLMEYYTGTEWKSIDAPPTITSFTINGGSTVTSGSLPQTSSNATIAINGSLFDTTGATVLFVGNGGGDVSPLTTVRNSSSLLTVTVNTNLFTDANEPYDLKVTNGSGLFALLENCITSNASPVFTTASGSLGTIFDSSRSSYSLSTAAATDADGDTITYSISAGSLPTGLSLNSSTAAITGTASAVGSNTTSTFTVLASTTGQTTSRQFSITVNAPQITTFTSGSGSFSVPAGITSLRVMVIGGGGSGGAQVGGAGGAGGVIETASFPVTPGGTVPYSIGSGGAPKPQGDQHGDVGQNTTFGSLTALGGGGGGNHAGSGAGGDGNPGGSGGAGGHRGGQGSGGSGTQPGQPGLSGSAGFGFPGGNGQPGWAGGGGGGAGGGGQPAPSGNQGGAGGPGRSSDISGSSVTYAGGGGGCGQNDGGPGGPGGGGNGEQAGSAQPGQAAGAGGGGVRDVGSSGAGSTGIVVVRI